MRLSQIQSRLISTFGIIILFVSMAGVIRIATAGNTLGYDFFYYWNSTRSFLFEGKNPYSTEVAVQNQIGLYGRPRSPEEDPSYFRNPIYAVIPILPFAFFPFEWAQSLWMSANILVFLASCYLAFPSMAKWIPILLLFSYQSAFGIVVGNLTTLAAAIIILCIGFLVVRERPKSHIQVFLGFLLVFATVKPQFSWLFIVWLILYSFRNKLLVFLASFALSLVTLTIVLSIFIPTWVINFLTLLTSYQRDANLVSARFAIFSSFFNPGTTILLGNGLLIISLGLTLFLLFKTHSNKFNESSNHLFFIGLTTFIAHPSGFSNEQLCLLIPIMVWLANDPNHTRWKQALWIVSFFLSYLFFYLERFTPFQSAILLGPLMLTVFWLGIFLIENRLQIENP